MCTRSITDRTGVGNRLSPMYISCINAFPHRDFLRHHKHGIHPKRNDTHGTNSPTPKLYTTHSRDRSFHPKKNTSFILDNVSSPFPHLVLDTSGYTKLLPTRWQVASGCCHLSSHERLPLYIGSTMEFVDAMEREKVMIKAL